MNVTHELFIAIILAFSFFGLLVLIGTNYKGDE